MWLSNLSDGLDLLGFLCDMVKSDIQVELAAHVCLGCQYNIKVGIRDTLQMGNLQMQLQRTCSMILGSRNRIQDRNTGQSEIQKDV